MLLRWIVGDKQAEAEEKLIARAFELQLSKDFLNSRKEYLKRFNRTFNTDNAKELCAVYAANRETRARYSSCLYSPAKAFAVRLFREHVNLKPRSVNFLSGGAGSGKSVLQGYLDREDRPVVLDGTLSAFDAARSDVEFALARTKRVRILHVHCPIDRAVHFAVVRAMKLGRTMSLDSLAGTHFFAPETLLRLAVAFQNVREVEFTIIDNTTHDTPKIRDFEFIENVRPKDSSVLKSAVYEAFSRAVGFQEKATGEPFPEFLQAGFAREGRKVA